VFVKKIYGVGTNDAGYPVTRNELVGGKFKQVWICPFYKAWTNMFKRCYCEKYQASMPTYEEACVDEHWHLFSNFRVWMANQVWEGLELDKEILSNGGKVYSEDTCCFVSRRINSMLLINPKTRGQFPIGASMTKAGKYQSSCKDHTAKAKNLGTYVTPMGAHAAWQLFKADVISTVASEYQAEPYFRNDVYYKLNQISDKLKEENLMAVETVTMWT
jgi:hypothetical protein